MADAQPTPDETRVLHLSRSFPAKPDLVFRALTRCEELSRWWGPRGFTVPDCTLDLRPGGAWRTVMRSPEGQDHVVSGVYREVEPPSRLAFTWGWERADGRGHETLVTIELYERGSGTLLVLTQEMFESASAREQHSHGWSSCFDCLEEALAEGAIT